MSSQTLQRLEIAATAGTMWRIDPLHSTIGFSVKHMMFATVHGRFAGFRGTIRFDDDHPDDAEVEVEIDAATIDTGIKKRDDHLRSADFFDVAVYPTISFRSTRVEPFNRFGRHHWLVVGNLTIHGVTRSVELAVEQTGAPEPWHTDVIEFGATATINRKDFGMEFTLPIEGGGLVVGNEVKIAISVQASKTPIVSR
ncbi:MAG: YceI family protein [Thermomicrobiales bacterium]